MNTIDIKTINTNKIKVSSWNPPGRITEKNLTTLKASIKNIGLIYPLVLNRTYQLIDGHRRFAIGKSMGWKEFPCIILENSVNESYGSINNSQRPMTGHELLGIYLKNSEALTGEQKKRIVRVENKFGKVTLKKLYDRGLTVSMSSVAEKLYECIGGRIDINVILDWVIDVHIGSKLKLRTYIEDRVVDVKELIKAIQNNKPLKLKMIVESNGKNTNGKHK